MTKKTEESHEIYDFIGASEREIASEYERIQKRAVEDPGTAGDQGEENWAALFKQWLPSYFQIVTKGRILGSSGTASPQVDVLILSPAYPKILLDKKLYLAGGVVAAFECKTTLKASHIRECFATSVKIRDCLTKRRGSPYRELNSSIIYGLLAHSHSWKGENSTPIENITKTLREADAEFVKEPSQCLDYITVADLGTWSTLKMTYFGPSMEPWNKELEAMYGCNGSAGAYYMCASESTKIQDGFASPLGVFLSGLFHKLAWEHTDMRELDQYFRTAKVGGSGSGQGRLYPIDIFSEEVRSGIHCGRLVNGVQFDEWSMAF